MSYVHYNQDQPARSMFSKKQAREYYENSFEVDLDDLSHESLDGLKVTEEQLREEFVELEDGVYAPEGLVNDHPHLFHRNGQVPPSSAYGWVKMDLARPGFVNYELNSTVKFGQSGSNGDKIPPETISDYLDTSNRAYVALILWVTGFDEIIERIRREHGIDREEAEKKAGDEAIAAEEYLKNRLDRVSKSKILGGTEFYKNSLGEIVDALGEYCGAKYIEKSDFEWRGYVEKNKEKYRDFLDNLSEIEDQRKRSYILAATTGFGKTATALDMVLTYSDGGTTATYNLLVSPMPRTLQNFVGQAHKFNHFHKESGENYFKFYVINTAENYFENNSLGDLIEGKVEDFVKAKENNEDGIHILMASVQDFKRKIGDIRDRDEDIEVEEEEVEKLLSEYEELEDFEFDVLLFDEAHHATDTDKMNEALEFFDWDHRILITATPEDYVTSENPVYERESAIFWLTRKKAYEMRARQLRNPEEKGHLEDYPEYHYRLLRIRDVVQNIIEEENHPPEEAWTPSKFFQMEDGDLRYRQAVIEFLKAFLDIQRGHLPPDQRRFSVYQDPKTDLCDFSQQVGLVSVPSGNSEELCKLLTSTMNEKSNSNTLFLHSYEYKDDIEGLEDKIQEDVLSDDGNYERAIIFTHNIFLTGFDKEWIGWELLLRNIRSSKFFDQATGRVGREGPKEKTNCAVYFAGINGFFNIVNEKHEALRQCENDAENYEEWRRDFVDIFNVCIPRFIDNGSVTWESMDHVDWKKYAKESIPSDEGKFASNVINDSALSNSSWNPGDNVTDSDSTGNGSPQAGPREGPESPGKTHDQDQQQNNSNGESDEDEELDEEEKRAKTRNIIIDFIINGNPLISRAEFEGDTFEDFIKARYYRYGGNRFTFQQWFDESHTDDYTRETIIKLYDEGIMNSRKMETWFREKRNKTVFPPLE